MEKKENNSVAEAIEFHKKKAEEASGLIHSIAIMYLVFCSLVVLPDLAKVALPFIDEKATYNGFIEFLSKVDIEVEKLKFLLTSLPLLFGAIIAGMIFTSRQHYSICNDLYRRMPETTSPDSDKLGDFNGNDERTLVLPVLAVSENVTTRIRRRLKK